MPLTLLLLSDDASLRALAGQLFRSPEIVLVSAGTAREGLAKLSPGVPAAVLFDLGDAEQSGLDAFREARALAPHLPMIVLASSGQAAVAIEAARRGAFDYLLKPADPARLERLVRRALQITPPSPAPAPPAPARPPEPDDFVGRSTPMQEIFTAIGRVAALDVNVLVLGESGTGKELVARAIHRHSNRAGRPFQGINCAAIPEALLESELFGHEKGAFTGADRRRLGKFEQANGGTLFLDEIGDMTPPMQAKILRVLQERQLERVGGNEAVRADVRVIAATHRALDHLVATGRFRADLYYRLCTFGIALPPLRDRLDDLPLLVEHFLRLFGPELGKDVRRVDPAALAALRGHSWPGNLRELQNVIKQALVSFTGPVLLRDFLPAPFREPPPAAPFDLLPGVGSLVAELTRVGSTTLHADVLGTVERELLLRILQETGGNKLRAARLLGITRGKFRTLLRKYGITVESGLWSSSSHSSPGSGSVDHT
jgi:two-component system nitrogen regulation response regulator GlnG